MLALQSRSFIGEPAGGRRSGTHRHSGIAETEAHYYWYRRRNAGQARQLPETKVELPSRDLLHRRRTWFCHRRPGCHSDVGRSIFCWLDIPSDCTAAHIAPAILDRAPAAGNDVAIRRKPSAVAAE